MFCAFLNLRGNRPIRSRVRARLTGVALSAALLTTVPVLQAQNSVDASQALTVAAVVVNRVNIFSASQAGVNPVYRLANRLHRTTLEKTIVRELGVVPGDLLTAENVAEFERLLRTTGLFASVAVQLVEDPQVPGTANLVIDTRDQFSIVAGASGSFLGGVGEFGITVGERNLLGSGDSITLSMSGNTDDEVRGALSYSDFHFISRDTRAVYQLGRTDEGDFAVARFSRPFKSETDQRAWSVFVESRQQDIDYFDNGLSVVQVPELRRVFNAERTWRSVTYGQRFRRGLAFDFRQFDYQQIRGSQSDTFEQPVNNSQVAANIILGLDSGLTHLKLTGLDTLQFVQDIGFGRTSEMRLGVRYSDYADNRENTATPLLSVRAANAVAWSGRSFLNVSASASAAFNENSTNWNVGAGAKFYHRWSQHHTLATRVNYRRARSGGQLPVQFTLGEDNGLRGYASRLLSGDERLQINLEHRINLRRKVGILDTGVVGFFDIGSVAQQGSDNELRRSAGVGLRLGSNALLGRRVIRMDVAVPFDDDAGTNEPTVSVAVGQVFSF